MKLKELNYKKDLSSRHFNSLKEAREYITGLLVKKDSLLYLDYDWRRKCSCGGWLKFTKGQTRWTYLHGSTIDLPSTPSIVSCEKCGLVYSKPQSNDDVVLFYNDNEIHCSSCGSVVFGFSKKKSGQEGWFAWNRYHSYYVCTKCKLIHIWGAYPTYATVWRDSIFGRGGSHVTEESSHSILIPFINEVEGDIEL